MEEFCGECGSELAPEDRFCQGCGAPVAQPAAAAVPTARAYQGPDGHGRSRGPAIAVLAVVAVAVLGAIAAGSYLLLGDDSGADQSVADWSLEASGYSAADRADDDPPASTSSADDDAADDVDAGATSGRDTFEPELEAGDYVQLGSFRGDSATSEATRLGEHGIDAFVIDSDGVAELLPGFKVVVAGPLAGRGERNRVMRAGRRAGIDGLDRTLSPLTTAPDPADIAGSFDGSLTRSPSERAVDASFSFAADGLSGSVDYGQPRCSSDLSFSESDLGTLIYDETVTSGRCADGGTWAFKPNGDQLRAAWNEPDSDYFVSGDLTGGDGHGE